MKLRETIRACQKCPLYKNMQTSPVPPEWVGYPKVAFVIDNILKDENDFFQGVVVGVNRARFLQLLKEIGIENYYLTNLVKCIPTKNRYRAQEIKTCVEWLDYEFEKLKPEYVIGCGPKTKIIKANGYCKSVGIITSSKKEEQEFVNTVRTIIGNDK